LAVKPPSDRIKDMRKNKLVKGEIYHIFNRGVDKRKIFSDQKDLNRFFQSMLVFNHTEPIGSLFEQSFQKDKIKKPLVKFVAYNLLPNHFHFILEQVSEGGISEFMKRLLGGYTWYFNNRHKRSGSLFQGTFKSKHIDSNEYLLHVSVYVNLNDKILLGDKTAKLIKSSWEEYLGKNKENFCKKDLVLDQFKNIEEYKKFTLSSLEDIRFNKEKYSELEK
jgi:putative transposase